MKIHVSQHRPAFVDTDAPLHIADVESVDELLAVPWIAVRGQDDLVARNGVVSVRPFYRWSIADKGTRRQTLMAEFDRGDYFWVVAFLTSDEPIPLPEWSENETARQRRERWNRGDTS